MLLGAVGPAIWRETQSCCGFLVSVKLFLVGWVLISAAAWSVLLPLAATAPPPPLPISTLASDGYRIPARALSSW